MVAITHTGTIMTASLLHQKWQQRLKAIRKEDVYEVYGRFIPQEWIPGQTADGSPDQPKNIP